MKPTGHADGGSPATPVIPGPVDDWPIFDDSDSLEECNGRLMALGLGDGLPLVPPTMRRLEQMLAWVAAPDASHGTLEPLHGEITPRAVAYQAVMAGCEPEWLDVVFSAILACRDPGLNLLGMQTTTGSAGVAVILHGEAANRVSANSSSNCLGPGNRANACIGRAVALTLKNVGGAVPGLTDMATIGQAGKYTLCFAEAQQHPAFPPLHVRRGLGEGDAAVTVAGVTGSVEVVVALVTCIESIVAIIAGSMQVLGALAPTPRRMAGGGEEYILTPPEVADAFQREGWSLQDAQRAIFDQSRFPWDRLTDEHRRHLPAPASEAVPGDARRSVPVARSPEDIHLVITGGTGAKMAWLPSWSGETFSVTREICDLHQPTTA